MTEPIKTIEITEDRHPIYNGVEISVHGTYMYLPADRDLPPLV